ncbi:MAG TPA: alpha-ketoglutarate-dependent dioxygenase AlkB [Flavisolibacter sp.]|nr:alpha-ketoglutarate-dependent dioxygenase AlkB [Flavisolibacter sp.]
MQTLFSIEPIYPEGFQYTPDFVTAAEETILLQEISKIELTTFQYQGYEAKRKTASFGFDYSFEKGKLVKGQTIPSSFNFIITRIADFINVNPAEIAELLVIEYPVGSVINWHRDAPPFDLIAGISLMSDCLFKLRPFDETLRSRKSTISIPVQRRSLYIMQGSSRSDWQHSIAPVTDIRYSITLRTLRK